MSIVVAKKNINYRKKLLIWNEFSKYTKNISFYNKENKVNYIENPTKINFSNIFSRVEKTTKIFYTKKFKIKKYSSNRWWWLYWFRSL